MPRLEAIPLHELDARIEAAERSVIERDQRIRGCAQRIATRARQRIGHSLGMGFATVAIGVALMAWRTRIQTLLAGGKTRYAHPLLRGLALGWPVLPRHWRERVPSPLVALLLAIGLKRTTIEPVQAAAYVDLARYAGDWYEIERLGNEVGGAMDARASYRLDRAGLAVANRCVSEGGQERVVRGRARVVDPHTGARLALSFAPFWLRWLPFGWTDYWILHVDPDYRHALVGTPNRRHLWLMSRDPSLGEGERARLVSIARRQGFDTARLRRIAQRAA
jgi:apolipoprotein D and lipocalin family protein